MTIELSESEASEGRFGMVKCKKCGTTFEITPPDDVHTLAAWSEEAFKENVKVEHKCPACESSTTVFWG